ncbi:MAG: response regulator [Chryseolinea sp.]
MNIKFLLIDDDPDDIELFCAALSEIDKDVVCWPLTGGTIALSKIEGNQLDQPDVIFLDVNMPIVSGWDVLSNLKDSSLYKEIPVVMYGTFFNDREIEKAELLGATCVMNKSFNYNKLKDNLVEIIARIKNGGLTCENGILNLGGEMRS